MIQSWHSSSSQIFYQSPHTSQEGQAESSSILYDRSPKAKKIPSEILTKITLNAATTASRGSRCNAWAGCYKTF